jgi:ribosome-associated heat shock protein Hsp15
MADDEPVRLDIWLDVSCLFKTRSQAQTACQRGRVEVNGDRGKAHRAVRPGDTIIIHLPGGRRRTIEVVELERTNVSKARARELYIDHTPPPTEEEVELRRMQRLSTPPRRERGAGAPKKRERRDLRRLKEEWD